MKVIHRQSYPQAVDSQQRGRACLASPICPICLSCPDMIQLSYLHQFVHVMRFTPQNGRWIMFFDTYALRWSHYQKI